ncbi:DUF5801 repeats-in-toxin domain-containing protein, partial [Hoeflea sp.]|uniref:DUF5801 repeats-in-toxin domain-containing protein n=1 Tax=Hoeflea sp. TaxID=1940281 RepID=UPI003A8CAB3D
SAPVAHPTSGASEENTTISIGFTVTDGDGDKASGTLNVAVNDDTPTGGAGTTAWLNDDTLTGGNTGGTGDHGLANVNNTLKHSFGADGAGGIAWTGISVSSGGNATDFMSEVSADGKILTVYQNGTLVITATITDPLTGKYSLVQNAPIDHVAGGNENEIKFKFLYDVKDGDGDVAAGYITVNVDDDTPVIPDHNRPDFRIISDDDTVAGLNGNPNGDGDSGEWHQSGKTLPHSFGADGGTIAWNADTSVVRDMNGNNGVDDATISFKVDDATGDLLLLQDQGGTEPVVVARVTVDPATGAYSYTQVANLLHLDDAANAENDAHFILGYTVTDGDNDTVEGTIDLIIDDDTPTGGAGTTAWLNDDTLTGGNADGTGDHGLANVNNTLKHSFGADGAGGIAWTGITVVNGGDAADFTTDVSDDGKTLEVYQNGTLVITATLDPLTGKYSLSQNAPIEHVAGGNENEIKFQFRYDVTDGDGDTAPGYIWVNVDDDTPVVDSTQNAAVQLDDDDVSGAGGNTGFGNPSRDPLPNGTFPADGAGSDEVGSVANGTSEASGTLDNSYGADGAGSLVLTGVTLPGAGGFSVTTSTETQLIVSQDQNGTSVEVLQITLSNTTDGNYTVTQLASINHAGDDTEDNVAFTVNYLVTDGDGDTATGTLDINVDDDTPVIAAHNRANVRIISDDDTVPGLNGNPGFGDQTNDGAGSDSKEWLRLGDILPHKFGADGAGSVTWNASTSGLNTRSDNGVDADSGITFEVDTATGDLLLLQEQGGTDPQIVARVELNTATGAYTFVKVANLLHNADGNTPGVEDDAHFILGYTVTDGDGDAVEGTIDLIIDDDTPVIAGAPAVQSVFEDGALSLTDVVLNVSWGADDGNPASGGGAGDRSIAFVNNAVVINGPAGSLTELRSNGELVSFGIVGGSLVGYTGTVTPVSATDAIVVFNVSLSDLASGSYTFNLLQPLDHAAPVGTDHYIDLTFAFNATDSDGDVSANSSFTVRVDAAGTISSIDYSALDTGVFVNLDDVAHTVGSQTVDADTATDRTGVDPNIVGMDSVLGINDAMGGSGDDVLIGGSENNILRGNDGNDTLVGGTGSDVLDGGDGVDTANYAADSGGIHVRLDKSWATSMANKAAYSWSDLVAGIASDVIEHDDLVNIENITGTKYSDAIVGDNGDNVIDGRDGDDYIAGMGGNDTLLGGDGRDLLVGGADDDIVNGGAGNDRIRWSVGDGSDTIDGGDDEDTLQLFSTAENQTITLDAVSGTPGFSAVSGADTASVQNVEEVSVDFTAGSGTLNVTGDFATSGVDISTIRFEGGSGNDVVNGSTMVHSTADSDVRIVAHGNDGNDELRGGVGNDELYGDDGNDILNGGDGDDFLSGGAGNDRMGGGSDGGSDVLVGGTGNDTIYLTKGIDTVYGNEQDTSVLSNVVAVSTENDIAIVQGSASGYSITRNADDSWNVQENGTSNVSTLFGIETIRFSGSGADLDLTANVFVFDASNNLVGTYEKIQQGIDAAGTDHTVEVHTGTYAEQVQIEGPGKDGLSLIASDGPGSVTITPPDTLVQTADSPTTSGRDIVSLLSVEGADNVTIEGITVDGQEQGNVSGVSPDNPTFVGIAVIDSDGGLIDNVTVTGIREGDAGFGNQRNTGIYVANTDTDATATPDDADLAGLNSIEIRDSTVTNFQKGAIVVVNANVNIHDNTVTGIGGTTWTAQNGIQVSGSTGTINDNIVSGIGYTGSSWAASVILTFYNNGLVIDGNTLTGSGSTDLVLGVAVIDSVGATVTNNTISDVQWAIDVEDYTSWPGALLPGGGTVFADNIFTSIGAENLYFAPDAATPSPFFVTGTDGTDAIFGGAGADTLEGEGGNDYIDGRGGNDILRGGAGDDEIHGGDGNDRIGGKEGDDTIYGDGGADQIWGDAGDDTIVWNVGDGADQISGGSNTFGIGDTLQVNATAPNQTITLEKSGAGSGFTVFANDGSGDVVSVSGVEEVEVDFTAGSGTLIVDGDFAGSGIYVNTITVEGGADNDRVDASLMSGTSANSKVGIDFNGNDGNDTFISGVGSDAFDGGDGLDTYVANDAGAVYVISVATDGTVTITDTVSGTVDTAQANVEFLNVGGQVFDMTANVFVFDDNNNLVGTYGTIQDGVAVADTGYTVRIAVGDYTLPGQLSITKSISIIGAGEGDVTVETAAVSWGIHVTASNVTISGLTLDASNSTVYGVKVNPATSGGSLTDFTLQDVTVQGAGRSEIDLNGVDNSKLTNVTADGMGTAGVGIALTDSTGIELTDITTTGNDWGSIGLYSKGQYYPVAGTNGISFNGDYTHSEATGIYADESVYLGNETFVTNIDFSGIFASGDVYVVQNDTFRGGESTNFTFFFETEPEAVAFALGLQAGGNTDSVITGPFDAGLPIDADIGTPLPGGATFIVADGMSIQEAIDHAQDGDTIIVQAGSFTENLIIDKDVTITGANSGVAGDGARGAESSLVGGVIILADGVSLDGLQIVDGAKVSSAFEFAGIHVQADDVSISNMLIERTGGFDNYRGIINSIGDAQGLEVTGSKITGFATGIYINPGSDATITGNVLEANNVGLSNDGPDATDISGNSFVDNQFEQIGVGVTNPGATNVGTIVGANSFTGTAPEVSIYGLDNTGQNIEGTTHDDIMLGGSGNDTLRGRGGNDEIHGGDGDDTVYGNSNTDVLYGDAGADTIYGGGGHDTITGGADDDLIFGGGGNDTVIWSVGDGADEIDGQGNGSAGDTLIVKSTGAGQTITLDATAGDDGNGFTVSADDGSGDVVDVDGIEEVTADFSAGSGTLKLVGDFAASGIAVNTIHIIGTSGDDVVDASEMVFGSEASKIGIKFEGGGGNDTFIVGGNKAAYTQTLNPNGTITLSGPGGTYVVAGSVETIQFDDTSVTVEPIWVVSGSTGDIAQFATIEEAIGASVSGDTVRIASGEYTLSSTLTIAKSLTIIGAGEDDVVIHSATGNGYGIHVTADDVHISDLTFDASGTSSYGFKVDPDTGVPTDSLTGFQLENVTVQGAGRSEIDLNGVDDSKLINVTADGMGTAGVGIALSDSTGIELTDITTTGNNWGSIGLYSAGNSYAPGTNGITFNGSFSHGEAIGIYADEENTSLVENIDFGAIFPDGVYAVQNDAHRDGGDGRGEDFTFFFGTEADAVSFALDLQSLGGANTASVITGPVGPDDVNAELGSTFIVVEGMSIQEAINNAADGDTIMVRAGTYNESLLIDKAVTLVSADGPGTAVIEGSLLSDLGVPPGMGLDEFFEANHPSYSGSNGISINADNVMLDGFTITGYAVGVVLGTSDGVSVINNVFTDNVTGVRKGTAAEVTDITINGNTFTNGIHGITIYAGSNANPVIAVGSFDGVTMNNNAFSDLSEKGMYFEQLSHAELAGNSFDGVGNYGRISPPFGGTDGEFGQAIDINLKHQTYEAVRFFDTVITNSGHSNLNGAGPNGDFGAAIGVKIRDDGSYSADPASFNGEIEFRGGSIDGTSTGFRIGEPGKDNDGPSVLIDSVLIQNASVTDVENATDPISGGVTTVNMDPLQGTFDGSTSQADLVINGSGNADRMLGGNGDDFLFGDDGNDILIGGSGLDELDGGLGADTFVFDDAALADAIENGIKDLIADYDIGENDVVDLSALLGDVVDFPTDGAGYVKMEGNSLMVDVDGADGDTYGYVAIAEFTTAPGTDALRILVDDDSNTFVTI